MSTQISDDMYDEEKNFLSNRKWAWLNPNKLGEFDASSKSIILCHQSDLLYGPNFAFFERHFKNNPRNMLIFIEQPPSDCGFSKSIKKVFQPSLSACVHTHGVHRPGGQGRHPGRLDC